MSPVELVPFLGLLILPLLLAILVLRSRQALRKDREELQTFSATHGFTGSLVNPVALCGSVDGCPAFLSEDRVGEGKGAMTYLRARVVTGDTATYRHGHESQAVALLVARSQSVPVDRVSGLHEVGSGDGSFDAAYRSFVTPGTHAPWQDPAIRRGILWLGGTVHRAERGPNECSVALARYFWRGALFDRALLLAASLTGAEAAARHARAIDAPFDARPPLEDRRFGWAVGRLLVVSIGGLVASIPLAYVPPVHDLVEYVACDGHEVLMSIGAGNRGVTEVCWDAPHPYHGASGWMFLIGLDAGLLLMLVLFGILELAVRSSRRR